MIDFPFLLFLPLYGNLIVPLLGKVLSVLAMLTDLPLLPPLDVNALASQERFVLIHPQWFFQMDRDLYLLVL